MCHNFPASFPIVSINSQSQAFKQSFLNLKSQFSHRGNYYTLTEDRLLIKKPTNYANWGETLNSETSISTAVPPTVHGE